MTTAIGIGIFVLGLCIGSFLSAAIYRAHTKGKSLVKGRSACPKCDHKLDAKDLIPVLSYLFQMGKCRYCKKHISLHYPLLEILTGALFAAVFFEFGATLTSALYILIGTFMIGIFFEDLLYKEISNGFMIPLVILALVLNLLMGIVDIQNMLIAVTVAILIFGGQIFLSKGKWLGGGDLKFGIFMGILLGWKLLLVAIFASYMLGAVISFVLLISGKATRRTEVAFGPMLIIGTLTAIFYGNDIINWYLNLIYLT